MIKETFQGERSNLAHRLFVVGSLYLLHGLAVGVGEVQTALANSALALELIGRHLEQTRQRLPLVARATLGHLQAVPGRLAFGQLQVALRAQAD